LKADELPKELLAPRDRVRVLWHALVRQLQQDVRGALDCLLRGEDAEFALPPDAGEGVSIFCQNINGKQCKHAIKFIKLRDLAPAFRHCVCTILEIHGPALTECPGCSRVFLADRSNKDYCDPLCRNRTYMRLKRRVPPERFGKRGRPRKIKIESSMDTPREDG